MKKFTLLIALSLVFLTFGFSQGCLPDGIYFTTQSAIDSFQINYPGCTEIEGHVHIYGDEIQNLDGLNVITHIGGDLYLGESWGAPPLTNLISLNGLSNLETVEGSLSFVSCNSLSDLQGLELLYSVGGYLNIGVDGIWTEEGNDSLSDISALSNLDPNAIDGLTIYENPMLSDCSIQSICDYLALPNNSVDIIGNALGCNSEDEVQEACESVDVFENITTIEITIYPNPATDKIAIDFNQKINMRSINIYNQLGQIVLQKSKVPNKVDISMLDQGLYFVEILTDKFKTLEKLVIN